MLRFFIYWIGLDKKLPVDLISMHITKLFSAKYLYNLKKLKGLILIFSNKFSINFFKYKIQKKNKSGEFILSF